MPTTKTKPTRPATTYSLSRFEADDAPTEDFELTAAQYDALKQHLAKLTAPPLNEMQAHKAAYTARCDAAKVRAKVISDLLGNLDGHDLETLETVRLMSSRVYCGIDDPISKFLCDLIFHYAQAEADGRGLDIRDIERELEQFKENMEEAISEARFISSRYSLAESLEK
jgi:hypothetical protein